MSDFAKELFRRKREQATRELEEAEREATVSGKEAFDVVRLDDLLGEAPGTSATDEMLLRERYYIVHRELHTLSEFAGFTLSYLSAP